MLKEAELRQSDLAEMTGYKVRQVARWLSGEVPVPKTVAQVLTIYTMLRVK